jgi:hypothetical protein
VRSASLVIQSAGAGPTCRPSLGLRSNQHRSFCPTRLCIALKLQLQLQAESD